MCVSAASQQTCISVDMSCVAWLSWVRSHSRVSSTTFTQNSEHNMDAKQTHKHNNDQMKVVFLVDFVSRSHNFNSCSHCSKHAEKLCSDRYFDLSPGRLLWPEKKQKKRYTIYSVTLVPPGYRSFTRIVVVPSGD